MTNMESFSQKSKEIENFFKTELIPISLSMEGVFYFGSEGNQTLHELIKVQESIDSGLFSRMTNVPYLTRRDQLALESKRAVKRMRR